MLFPVTCGVVLTGITRRQFDEAELGSVIGLNLVICQDEMTESVDRSEFQDRLLAMFAYQFGDPLVQAQIDRVRWNLFPEVRVPQTQMNLFNEEPDIERVMDLKQEQLARSLGEGHRVIHGVAGSGKTMILCYRAEYLARANMRPILILCFNKSLSKRLARAIQEKKLETKVHVRTFHQWCLELLRSARIAAPVNHNDNERFFSDVVRQTTQSVSNGRIARAQYDAILIDEAHDFESEWLSMTANLLDSKTNSLLVLYDDAQSIYAKTRKKFSFKSVGIQAAGRTTILRVNYRNTLEILDHTASVVRDLLMPRESDDDGIPLISPIGGGRHGPQPNVFRLPTLKAEAELIAKRFHEAHGNGMPWNSMAMIYRDYAPTGKEVIPILRRLGVPVTYHKEATFAADEDTVKALTMHGCKGLEFRLVAIPGAGMLRLGPGDGDEDARLFYVAMTRATHELLICRSDAALAA
jgi:superfamily I DNA/RNA helicase